MRREQGHGEVKIGKGGEEHGRRLSRAREVGCLGVVMGRVEGCKGEGRRK